MWRIESPLEDLHNSWPVISRWAINDVSESLTGQRAIHVHDASTEEVGGATTANLYRLLASFGVTPKKSSYLKGLLVTPPSSGCMSVGDGCFFLSFNQTSILNAGADMRSQLFSIKPDTKEVCKNVNQCHSSQSLFSFGEIFIMSSFMK